MANQKKTVLFERIGITEPESTLKHTIREKFTSISVDVHTELRGLPMKKVCTVLLALCIILVFTSCKSNTQNTSISLTPDNTTTKDIYQPTSVSDDTTLPNLSGSSSQSSSTTQTTTTTVQNAISRTSTTAFKTTTTIANIGPKHPTSGIPWDGVTQADPETGLSWDGVSPIVYTYEDGTTGTVPKDNAKFEFVPGLKRVYTVFKDGLMREYGSECQVCGKPVGDAYIGKHTCYQFASSQYCSYCGNFVKVATCHSCERREAFYCSRCGKVEGNGLSGTCASWVMSDVDCPNCGEHVKVHTCHTCTRGCKYCDKSLGNGENGTCYRDSFSPTKCPSCGADVPTDTCHSCK